MSNLSHLYLFIVASFVMLIIPGPAVVYIAIQSVKRGRIAGIVAVLGLELGTVFHVIAAAFGISTLSSSTLLFNLIKCFGTTYLIYLGARKLFSIKQIEHKKIDSHERLSQIFWQGILVEILNPKTMLFFFAFLPQFIDNPQDHVAFQMLSLGFLFVGLATLIDLFYATAAGAMGEVLKGRRWFVKGQRYVESSIYTGLGIATALSGAKS